MTKKDKAERKRIRRSQRKQARDAGQPPDLPDAEHKSPPAA